MHIKSLKKGMVVRTEMGRTGRMLHDYEQGTYQRCESLNGKMIGNFVTTKLAFVQHGDEWHAIQRGKPK